jgi:hypothetical protein
VNFYQGKNGFVYLRHGAQVTIMNLLQLQELFGLNILTLPQPLAAAIDGEFAPGKFTQAYALNTTGVRKDTI